jgi:MoaA/NifB/PqqE/SkfB family radical SAM enzyme
MSMHSAARGADGSPAGAPPLPRFQMPGLQELHLQGLGEPMLQPQFFEMVAMAAARGVKVSANRVLRNLARRVDAHDAAGSPLQVRLVMVLMRANLHELPALVRLAHRQRVPEVLVQRLSHGGDG